jgi:hypothetical protein
MQIQKASNFNKSDLLERLLAQTDSNKQAEAQPIEEQKVSHEVRAKKITEQDPVRMNRSTVLSAGRSDIADNSATPRRRKLTANNSIFDPNVLERQSRVPTSDETSKVIKEQAVERKNKLKANVVDQFLDHLKGVDTRSESTITPLAQQGSTMKEGDRHNSMSMFSDERDFEGLPDKTSGEKLADENKARREKEDDSWRSMRGAFSNKDVTNRLFDSLFGGKNK